MSTRIHSKQITGLTKLAGNNFLPNSATAVITEVLVHSFLIKGSDIQGVNCMLDFFAFMQWNATAGTKQFKVYFSATNSLADVNKALVATSVSHSTNSSAPLIRRFMVKNATTIRLAFPSNAAIDFPDVTLAGTNVPVDVTVPSLNSDFYVLISATKSVTTDTATIDHSYLNVFK